MVSTPFDVAFERTCYIDGVVLKTLAMSPADMARTQSEVERTFQVAHPDTDSRTHNRLFKPFIFRMNAASSIRILKVGLWGVYANSIDVLDFRYSAILSELHFKAYTSIHDVSGLLQFQASFLNVDAGRQPFIYGSKGKGKATAKGSGKGVTLGVNQSGLQFVHYQRTGQLMGLELRIKGMALQRIVDRVGRMLRDSGASNALKWTALLRECKFHAARAYIADLHLKGFKEPGYNLLHHNAYGKPEADWVEFSFEASDSGNVNYATGELE